MVRGESLAVKIESLLPPLDQAVGNLIAALAKGARRGTTVWKSQARELRAGLQALAAAIERAPREALPLDDFAPLWSTLIPLGEGGRAPIGRLARKAAAAYEPIWRELVRAVPVPPGKRVVRGKEGVDILCEGCGAPALRFSAEALYTRVRLDPDEYAFLKPLVGGLGTPTALAAYLRKRLRFGLAEYCRPCGAFYCAACSPSRHVQYPYSDQEPTLSTCPAGHERQTDQD